MRLVFSLQTKKADQLLTDPRYSPKKNGAPAGTRTLDPMIKSHLLYQLSYEHT